MLVFDLSREETYLNINEQLENIRQASGLDEITIVANKKDLVSSKDLTAILELLPLKVDLITSAKEGENVENAFLQLASQAINKDH